MGRLRVVFKWPKCGSERVIVEKIIKYESKTDLYNKIMEEILEHDGFGWDVNTFTIKCAECGEVINKVTFEELD